MQAQTRFSSWFRSLVSRLFVSPAASQVRRRLSRFQGSELLEPRALLATYGVTGTTLNIDLNVADQKLQVYANGTSYVFALSTAATNTWTLSGTLPSGHSITNSAANLTTANLSAFSTVNITDSAANTSVWFETGSNGTFADNFNLNLDNLSNSVKFNGTNTFNGTNALSVTIDSRVEVPSAKSLTMTNGNLDMSINMQATPQTLPFSGLLVNNGTIQTTGTGQTTIAARGGNGIASSFYNKGVAVVGGGTISGGTSGTLSITGYGYNNLSIDSSTKMYGQGVFVSGQNAASVISQITSLGANVAVTGYGANDTTANLAAITANAITNAGVVVGCQTTCTTGLGLITSGGNGTVSVTGYGGSLVDQPVVDTSASSNYAKPMGVLVSGGCATISSGGAGLVNVTGFGGGTTANSLWGTGVSVYNGNINSGANGSVAVNGTGFLNSNANQQFGVLLYGTGCISTGAGSGHTTVTGQGGGSGSGSGFNAGVYLYIGGTITAGGSGNVTVTGTGGSAASSFNRGVLLSGNGNVMPIITSNGGDVLVTGYGGNGGVANSYAVGVEINVNSRITAGGQGDVTVRGYGGNNNGTLGNNNHGVSMTSSGAGQMPSFISSSGGNVTVLGIGGGGDANSTANSPMANNVGVSIQQGSYITAGGMANVSVTGQGGGRSPGATGNNNHGVLVSDGNRTTYSANNMAYSYISSSGGQVTVTGTGGGGSGSANDSTSASNYGVYVKDGGSITSGGNADVQVNGTGGGFGSSSGGSQFGVLVEQVKTFSTPADSPIFRSTITSGGNGSVTIKGQGGGAGSSNSHIGVRLATGAIITSGGSGDVTVNGTGGNLNGSTSGFNTGVELTVLSTNNLSPTITSGGGNITVNGIAGGQGGTTNYGVNISSGGLIIGPANASVSVTGRGGNLNGTSGNNNNGVNVNGVSNGVRSSITSNNGTVSVTGYGGQTNTTVSSTSSNNTGVYVSSGACISSGGAFPVTVTGFGGGLGTGVQSFNYGVGLQTLNGAGSETPQITSAGGTVTVNGTGGGTNGSGANSHGVSIQLGGRITSAGNGTAVNVIGTGGGASQTNHGVFIAGCTTSSNQTITSNNGPITITGTAGAGGQGVAGCSTLATVVGNSTTPGNVTIIADSVALPTWTGSAVNAAERLIITPRTAGVAIDLGGSVNPSNGPLTLSQGELSTLNAPTMQLGNATTGNVTLTSGVTFPTASNVTLYSNGTGSVLSATACATDGMTMGAGKTLDVSTLPIIASSIGGTSLGIGYTRLKVVGDLSIAGKTLSLSGGYTPAAGNVFTIVNATNLTGTFTGLADGSTVTFNGKTLIVNYTSTSVTLTEPSPFVTTNPTSVTVTAGSAATFTAAALGIPTPTVKWQVSSNSGTSWSDMTGETNPTLNFTAAIADDGKLYRAVFTNTYGTATTTSATLTVQHAPTVTTQPTSQTVNPGDSVTFTAAASGNPAPTVKWQVDSGSGFVDISGATSPSYSLTASLAENGYLYRAVFTNGVGSDAISSSATLTVSSGSSSSPVITTHPTSTTVTAGGLASFTAAATGSPTPTVKWQSNSGSGWSDIAGATSVTYSFLAAAGNNGVQYRAVFTNGVGSDATTNPATLTVQYGPTVTTQPTSQTVLSGATVTFTAAASGNPTPTVKWQSNSGSGWSDIAGATSVTYSFTAAVGDNGVQYRAVFTNGVGSDATTNPASLTVPSLSTFTVSKGQAQRSYVRYLDIGTDSSATANALSLPGRVRLLKADLNGNGSTVVPLTGFVSASGSTLAIDFGAVGLGASRNTNSADGYYTLGLDLDGDGVFESSRRFYRLLGDVNGDRQVNTTDVSLVNAGMTTAYNSALDINGDGVVNASDLMFVNRAKGRKLADGLLLD